MFYFLCSKPFSLSHILLLSPMLCLSFYGVSFDPALVNWNVQEPFILQTYYVRTPNISTKISLIPIFLSYFIIPIIFSVILFSNFFQSTTQQQIVFARSIINEGQFPRVDKQFGSILDPCRLFILIRSRFGAQTYQSINI